MGRNQFEIEGTVMDEDGNKLLSIQGHWNESISVTDLESGDETTVWKIKPPADNAEEQYGLTRFAIDLNHLPDDLRSKLPPTDSRFRPDLRAFEEGDIDLGADEKHRLEEKQRAARAKRKEDGTSWEPVWFEEVIDEDTETKFYKIKDTYWQSRLDGDWDECPDIF